MSKQEKIIPENIHLLSIKVFQAKLETAMSFLDDPPNIDGYQFGITHEMAHVVDDGLVRFRLYFNLKALDTEERELGLDANYGIEFHFHVEDFTNFYKKNKHKEVQFDIHLGAMLIGIGYSTARGIILERMHGTFFEGVILPVIDPYEVLKDDNTTAKGNIDQSKIID